MAANAVISAGAIVALDASGDAIPGDLIAAGATVIRGVACEGKANTGGGAGDETVNVWRGTYRFKNSIAGDAITRSEIGDTDRPVVDANGVEQSVSNFGGGAARPGT